MRFLRPMVCLITFLLVGCASTTVVDQSGPPAVTLADTAPKSLAVAAGVTVDGYTASTRSTTEIALQFMSQGRLVRFVQGETLACNGTGPVRLTTGFDQSYPTTTVAGRPFTCIYTSGYRSARIQFSIPRAPTILAPTDGTAVARSTATVVHFQAEGPIAGIVALGAQDKAIAHITVPGIATVDTSQFATGAGQISLTQYPQITDASATAFSSLQLSCTTITSVDIVWR